MKINTATMYMVLIVLCAMLLSAYIWMWYDVKIEDLEKVMGDAL